MGPTSTSTPNKIWGGPCHCSSSSDSRRSMTPFEMGMYGSFSYPSGTGMCRGSLIPVTSVAGSQLVTSSRWQLTGLISPLLSQAMDTLSTKQAVEIYQLAAECQALGSELTKQFQNLSRLKAVHRATAQAAAHKTINVECMVAALPLALPQPPKQMRNMSCPCAGSAAAVKESHEGLQGPPKEAMNEASTGSVDCIPTMLDKKKRMSKDPSPGSWLPPQSSQGSLCRSQHAKKKPTSTPKKSDSGHREEECSCHKHCGKNKSSKKSSVDKHSPKKSHKKSRKKSSKEKGCKKEKPSKEKWCDPDKTGKEKSSKK